MIIVVICNSLFMCMFYVIQLLYIVCVFLSSSSSFSFAALVPNKGAIAICCTINRQLKRPLLTFNFDSDL